MSWEAFVRTHGAQVRKHLLAHILGVSEKDIDAIRASGTMGRRRGAMKTFAELFSLWHGRAPVDADWPAPRRMGRNSYEWLVPEMTLAASLLGQMAVPQIAQALTVRLRALTGDRRATRTANSVILCINRMGLQTNDVAGGLTVPQAGAEIGSEAMVYQAIQNRSLQPRRVGRLWVIPHDQWEAWKAKRVAPPKGYVRLVSLRDRLGIKSDSKLPEFASMGYIPTAIRCNPMGANAHNTKFGTWYIAPEVARKLIADRRAGRPMPWHGKPLLDNLRITWKLFEQRRHPADCQTCRDIWGRAGAPTEFDDYVRRYPPLALGAKRHLTMVWHPGWTVAELAADAGVSVTHVRRAIDNGLLAARGEGRNTYITRTDATRWRARKCPTGGGRTSWITLASAKTHYGFTVGELSALISEGKLKSKKGSAATGGRLVVCRQQCAQLRERQGCTEIEAAKRVGVSLARFRELLEGVRWRAAPRIPLVTVQAVGKRLESQQGMTVPEAAKHLRRTEAWVRERIEDGTVRVTRARWDTRRLYLTLPMIERLRAWRRPKRKTLTGHWLALGEAAKLAGVTTSGLTAWNSEGTLKRRKTADGYRYHRFTVQARARRYWSTTRRVRARPPAWFVAEQGA